MERVQRERVRLERVARTVMAEELLNVGEVSTLLKLRPVTIYRWCRAGRLAGIKIGKEWRIPRETVTALLRASGWERDLFRNGEDETMNNVSLASRELARRILLHESGGRSEPAAILAAAVGVHGRLRGRLAGVIGGVGFATLFARARHLEQAEFPVLAQFAFGEETTIQSTAGVGSDDLAVSAAGVSAVLATFIELLGTFIGEDLAVRLIRDAWSEVPDEVFGRADTAGGA
jgi:excisionase family DNA binding protein